MGLVRPWGLSNQKRNTSARLKETKDSVKSIAVIRRFRKINMAVVLVRKRPCLPTQAVSMS